MGLLTLEVLLILGTANHVLKLPKPLLIVSGAFFLTSTAIVWFVGRRAKWHPAAMIASTFFTWLPVTLFFLWWLYHWDRAGWLWSTISGYDATLAEDFSGAVDLPAKEFVRKNSIFKIDSEDSSKLILPSGEYQIDQTIVVPRGISLMISPGVTMRFGVGCSLISYGPIIAKGTENTPIVFTAQNKWRKWGVVGVVSRDSSVFDYTIFEHGRQALVNGVEFTGCLSLRDSVVHITNCRFMNLYGKDAVSVRRSKVLIRNNTFENTSNDGLDLDGGAGEVSRNRFVNCGDESIDLSGNDDLRVFDNQIIDARGGRIAADKNLEQIKSQNTLKRLKI